LLLRALDFNSTLKFFSWWKGDEEVTSSDILRVSHSANCAKLMFIPAKRALAGKYTLKAKNKHGEDSAELQIDVVGKPTMPTGPLQVIILQNFTKNIHIQY
jgi:titin